MANNLKIFGKIGTGNDVINSYAGVSGAEHDGFKQNTFMYVDQINTALRNTSLVTYTLVDILSAANAVNIDTTTSEADAKITIKAALDAYIAGTVVTRASTADLATDVQVASGYSIMPFNTLYTSTTWSVLTDSSGKSGGALFSMKSILHLWFEIEDAQQNQFSIDLGTHRFGDFGPNNTKTTDGIVFVNGECVMRLVVEFTKTSPALPIYIANIKLYSLDDINNWVTMTWGELVNGFSSPSGSGSLKLCWRTIPSLNI